MIDTLTTANHRDFAARYSNTYGFFTTESGRRMLVYVARVDQASVKFADKDGASAAELFEARVDRGVEFEFIQVTRGYFNTSKHVYLLTRVPQRQWKRGISQENTHITILGASGRNSFGPTHEVLLAIFCGTTPPIAVLWRQFQNGERGAVALSSHFAVAGTEVWFFDKLVGVYKEGTIVLKSNVLLQELSDVVRRADIPLMVSHE
jgi:hypothetical protein